MEKLFANSRNCKLFRMKSMAISIENGNYVQCESVKKNIQFSRFEIQFYARNAPFGNSVCSCAVCISSFMIFSFRNFLMKMGF